MAEAAAAAAPTASSLELKEGASEEPDIR
eukprot:COSAG04_NODE_25437_length_307_cov_1.062500_1_plen_28_part_10